MASYSMVMSPALLPTFTAAAGVSQGKKKGRAGRKGYDKAALLASIQTLSPSKRTKIRTLATAVGVSVDVVQRLLKANAIVRHTNTIMPSLTDANKTDRVRFAVSHVNPETLVYDSMHDVVHIDEKWLNEDVDKRIYYLLSGEQPPERRRKSKRFIGKTMFLAAVARPWKCMFDGKIGLWPFVEEYVAKRNSKNRQKGTILTVNIEVVNRDVYRQFLIDCVISAIKMKWPARDRHNTIYIQQDNTKPHVFPDDEAIVAAGQKNGWDIRLRFQPPNSPDCNVLDLGYIRAIQSLQYEQEIYRTDD
uniref:Uncharacterized protein AlNc14C163G7834 n=1 Tax=Albugo laibachii Nc14 TaxID=890382 RepID=F0WMZ7_9STRA|nr:hypothetical protein OsJ_02110 [Albugo laibachii Nc14]|eukprot:CCA22684.1 hypothetical protein OsJ_02110 [Albugo laibachii Nc14]